MKYLKRGMYRLMCDICNCHSLAVFKSYQQTTFYVGFYSPCMVYLRVGTFFHRPDILEHILYHIEWHTDGNPHLSGIYQRVKFVDSMLALHLPFS